MENFHPTIEIISIVGNFTTKIKSIEMTLKAIDQFGRYGFDLPDGNSLTWSKGKDGRRRLTFTSLGYTGPFVDAPIEDQLLYGKFAMQFLAAIINQKPRGKLNE